MIQGCSAARRQFLAGPGPRNLGTALAEAQTHLGQCPSCRTFVAGMNLLAEGTRAAVRDVRAPAPVRERLFTGIADARSGGRRLLPWHVAAASLAAVLVMGAVGYVAATQRPITASLVQALVQDHASTLSGDRIETGDKGAIQEWLTVRLSFAVFIPELEGAQLVGARLCATPHGRGAVLEYRLGDRTVSYFVLPSQPVRLPGPGAFRHAYADGYRAVLWSHMGLVHAMLGALPPDVLERLARDCVKQAAAASFTAAGRRAPTTGTAVSAKFHDSSQTEV